MFGAFAGTLLSSTCEAGLRSLAKADAGKVPEKISDAVTTRKTNEREIEVIKISHSRLGGGV